MGVCFSISNSGGFDYEPSLHASSPTAKVVSINGSLREYPVPVAVSQVLQNEQSSSTTTSSTSMFMCNSDKLYYDKFIPALDSEHELEANQIYFVLPSTKLERRLTASDMAAMAVRASLALQNAPTSSSSSSSKSNGKYKRRRKNRVSPVFFVKSEPRSDGDYEDEITIGPSNSLLMNKKKTTASDKPGLGISRSGSVRKMQRYTSKRAMKAVRSFRLGLTTIDEGSVL